MSNKIQSTRSRWSHDDFHSISRRIHLPPYTLFLKVQVKFYSIVVSLINQSDEFLGRNFKKSAVMRSLTDDALLSFGPGPKILKIESKDEGQLSTNHMICILINYFSYFVQSFDKVK